MQKSIPSFNISNVEMTPLFKLHSSDYKTLICFITIYFVIKEEPDIRNFRTFYFKNGKWNMCRNDFYDKDLEILLFHPSVRLDVLFLPAEEPKKVVFND
jgi:hypothetical protein